LGDLETLYVLAQARTLYCGLSPFFNLDPTTEPLDIPYPIRSIKTRAPQAFKPFLSPIKADIFGFSARFHSFSVICFGIVGSQ